MLIYFKNTVENPKSFFFSLSNLFQERETLKNDVLHVHLHSMRAQVGL